MYNVQMSTQKITEQKELWIAPSILAADFACLGNEVENVLDAGADIIHFDVMDNHYVPNLSIGPLVLESLTRHLSDRPQKALMDVHLMVKPVDRLIGDFLDAGADYITFHPEASEHVHRSLGLIKEGGAKAGLVFNPATSLEHLDHVLELVDMVLIMSVNPGFGGQAFIPASLNKLADARAIIDASGRDIRLEIDGGIKTENIAQAALAGADTFVAGSAIFGSADYANTIAAMRSQLQPD
jgi:ribulose-phosphate 3-epimerase